MTNINIKKVLWLALICIVVGGLGSIISYRLYGDATVVQTKEIDATDIQNIKMLVHNEKVEIIPTSDSIIKAELTGKGTNNSRLTAEKNGNTWAVETADKSKSFFRFHFFDWNQTLKIYLPQKVYQSLHAEIDNGSVQIDNLEINDLTVDTSNGEISVSHLQTVHSELSTNNGEIYMENINSESVRVSTNNGKIEMKNIDGELKGKAHNGSISLETKQMDRPIDLQTHNGKININTDEKPTNVTFNTSVHNGKITIFGNSNGPLVIGDGEHAIVLKTHNGSITVE